MTFLTFNFDTDVRFALHKKFGGETLKFIHHAEDPDLTAFNRHGGKMIVWHGASDPLPNPVDTIDYYNSIRTRFSHNRRHADKTEDFVRLFLLPNVGHCGGAAPGGPNTLDLVTALEDWVEERIAPEEIIASRVTGGVVTRTRPICAYPKTAQYVGSGSIDDAANFVCRKPHDRDRHRDDGH